MSIAPSTIFVVDDDESVRRSLRRLLTGVGYLVNEFSSAEEFLDRPSDNEPGCALLDLAMPGIDGLQLQQELMKEKPELGIVFLSGHGDIPASVEAMKNGAVDFLTKPVDEEILLAAVHTALEYAHRQAAIQGRFATLTSREVQVLHQVVSGARNKQIAAILDISEKTVKVHRAHLMEKTGSKSLAELVQLCTSANIV